MDGKDIVEAALTRIESAPGSDQSTLLSDAAERFGKCLGFASVYDAAQTFEFSQGSDAAAWAAPDGATVDREMCEAIKRDSSNLSDPAMVRWRAFHGIPDPAYLGIAPVSPHDARLASLEADLARLIAENTRLAASNSVLQRGMQIIAAADVPEPTKAGIPARALGRHAQRIGLLTGIW